MTPVSNFLDSPDGCKHSPAVFSLWHPDDPSLTEGGVPLSPLTGLLCQSRPSSSLRANLATDFSPSVVRAALHSELLLVPVLVQPLFPSLSPHSTLWRRPHKARRLVRFSVLRRIDRPEQSAANCLQISRCCVHFRLIYPATNTLFCRLVAASKPVCRGRPYWTLACPLSTCSGWDGRSSQQQSSTSGSSFTLPPAGFLQTNTRVHHTVSQDSPSRGAVTGHSKQRVHTLSRNNADTQFQA